MQFLEKPWEMRENRDIKLVATEKRRSYLVSEPNYHKLLTNQNINFY